jgi:hypothetical protein
MPFEELKRKQSENLDFADASSTDDERREEFHRTWVDFFETEYRADGEIVHDREYLLVLGTRH